jgi:hypothetical protein
LPGFFNSLLENLHEFTNRMDEDTQSWEPFLNAIHRMFPGKPFTVKELSQSIQQPESQLEEVLPPDLAEVPEGSSAAKKSFERVLGKAFARVEGRRFGPKQYHIIRCGERSRAILWKVCREGK